ncbi:MAG: DUF4339 domain-containing protein, partial [Verrucomicrobia bacterium]|nr:DUF4339 domain-containing protein [Verrucomicrobiota bacterium]
MDWYYAEGGKQKGTVTQEQLRGLVRDGTVKLDTLVWREGMANWQMYGQITAGPNASGMTVTCSQCGKSVVADKVIRYCEQNVCAECKPAFVQRIKEGLGVMFQQVVRTARVWQAGGGCTLNRPPSRPDTMHANATLTPLMRAK